MISRGSVLRLTLHRALVEVKHPVTPYLGRSSRESPYIWDFLLTEVGLLTSMPCRYVILVAVDEGRGRGGQEESNQEEKEVEGPRSARPCRSLLSDRAALFPYSSVGRPPSYSPGYQKPRPATQSTPIWSSSGGGAWRGPAWSCLPSGVPSLPPRTGRCP